MSVLQGLVGFITKREIKEGNESIVAGVNDIWRSYCAYRATAEHDKKEDEKKALIVKVQTFFWHAFRNSFSLVSVELKESYEASVKKVLSELVNNGSISGDTGEQYANNHELLIAKIHERKSKALSQKSLLISVPAFMAVFLMGYKLYHYYTFGVESEGVEMVRPRTGYVVDAGGVFVASDKYKNQFLKELNNNFFNVETWDNDAKNEYLYNGEYGLEFKFRLRNASSTLPIFVSSVGAEVVRINEEDFDWGMVNTETNLTYSDDNSTAKYYFTSRAGGLDFNVVVKSLDGTELSDETIKYLGSYDQYKFDPYNPAGAWRYVDIKHGKITQPITVKVSTPSDNSRGLIDCKKAMFGISEPWTLLRQISTKQPYLISSGDIFSRRAKLILDGIYIGKKNIKKYLDENEYRKEEIEIYLQCYGEEAFYDVLRTEEDLKKYADVVAVKGFEVSVSYNELNGKKVEGIADKLLLDEGVFLYKFHAGPSEDRVSVVSRHHAQESAVEKASVSGGYRDLIDSTAKLFDQSHASTISGDYLIKAPLRISVHGKEKSGKWLDVDKVLGAGGYMVADISLLSISAGKYRLNIYVNHKLIDSVDVISIAPKNLLFKDRYVSEWISVFRK